MLVPKLQKLLLFADSAREKGCTRAELILAKELRVDDRVRLKCRLNTCGNYGSNLMCPPAVPDLAETARIFASYTFALVLQITTPLDTDDYLPVFRNLKNQFSEIILTLEKEAFRQGFTLATGFSGGNCTLCEVCAGTKGQACRLPAQARPSMEAFGLDVGAVCRQLGLPSEFIPGEITLTGMLLID